MKSSKNQSENVMIPKFKFDERLKVDREVEIPSDKVFMPIGYNRARDDGMKQYRRYYPDELENIPEVMQESPFLSELIFRMK